MTDLVTKLTDEIEYMKSAIAEAEEEEKREEEDKKADDESQAPKQKKEPPEKDDEGDDEGDDEANEETRIIKAKVEEIINEGGQIVIDYDDLKIDYVSPGGNKLVFGGKETQFLLDEARQVITESELDITPEEYLLYLASED